MHQSPLGEAPVTPEPAGPVEDHADTRAALDGIEAALDEVAASLSRMA